MNHATNRHAYCIIAHNDPYCLHTLIELIDDERNDIFVLYDKKCDRHQFGVITAKYSRIIMVPPTIDIYWGHISLILAELTLFETVINSQATYDYIHLLSGIDLPLHDQDYIHEFFRHLPPGTNLISFADDENNRLLKNRNTQFRHILIKYCRSKNLFYKYISAIIRRAWIAIQKCIDVKVDWSGYDLAKGSNWVRITPAFATYLVANKQIIAKKFKYALCGDEIYKQTLAMSSLFKDTLLRNNMRKIDWQRGNPYIWRMKDAHELTNSDFLFARKFQSGVDKEIIDFISETVRKTS